MNLEQLGELNDEDEVEYAYQKLKKSWRYQKFTKSKNALFKAIILAYKCKFFPIMSYLSSSFLISYLLVILLVEYLSALCINIVTTMLNLSSPYMIKKIIDFINDDSPTKDTKDGLMYVGLLVFTQSLYYLISEHLDFR